MNRAGLDMIEADSYDQIRGLCLYPLVSEEYREIFKAMTQSVFKGESRTLEFKMIGLKGKTLWLYTHAVPFRNEKGEIVLALATTIDITERKQAEEALREEEGKYRLLFESANDGIFIQDETGFIDCNEKAAGMYGLPKEEIIGRSPSEFAPVRQPDGRLSSEVAGEKIWAALSGVPQIFEWQPIRADGSPFDVEVTLSRLELGGKMYLQAIVRDISERKRLEQEILRGQKLESVGILAGGIAHDFNNLLQAIMGNISLAKMLTNPKEKAFPLLEESEKASEQAKELSYRLLTFSKGGDPVRSIASAEDMLRETVSLCLSGSNVGCKLSLPKDLEPIEVDKGQINQVFNNLLINAKEAMPDGGTVEISASNVRITGSDNLPLKEGQYVKISLADHGTGISKEDLPRIFDPYFSTKERGSQKGMGLGLAICHSIVAKHEGHIGVESEVGAGTTFYVYLPASPKGKVEEKTGKDVGLFAVRGRVLFMDDDERVRRITGAMLQQLGYDVEFARNGEEAIDRYRTEKESGKRIDAVILDLTVQGGMGGEKALRMLLEMDPEIKAVISSGYADDPVMKNFRSYGFLAAIPKPYTVDTLGGLLENL